MTNVQLVSIWVAKLLFGRFQVKIAKADIAQSIHPWKMPICFLMCAFFCHSYAD